MKTTDFKSFNYLENGEVYFSKLDTIKTTRKLESGCYVLQYLEHPEYRVLVKKDSDEESVKIHNFPDKKKIDALVNSFFDKKVIDAVEKLGFNHKVGILLYGKEGTGKSTILKHYYTRFIKEHNAIVFNIKQLDYRVKEIWEFVKSIRQIQDNPIIIMFDEFDAVVQDKGEAMIKPMIDGSESIHNSIFMATTNYIDKIPDAMKNRQSRFKYALDIEGIQCSDDIYEIISGMIGNIFDSKDIKIFSNDLKGETLDHIKQFCLDKIMLLSNENKKQKLGFKLN